MGGRPPVGKEAAKDEATDVVATLGERGADSGAVGEELPSVLEEPVCSRGGAQGFGVRPGTVNGGKNMM